MTLFFYQPSLTCATRFCIAAKKALIAKGFAKDFLKALKQDSRLPPRIELLASSPLRP
jgi:hypothetical protein